MVVLRRNLIILISLLLSRSAFAQEISGMGSIVQRAMDYQALERVESLRQESAIARLDSSNRLVAGNPSFTLSQKSDRWNKNLGEQEDTVGVSLPLWRWGERQAATTVAASELVAVQAESLAAKNLLAGNVRDSVWGYIREHLRQQTLEKQIDEAEKTELDARRRFEAGDLAKVDWLNAKVALQGISAEIAEQNNRINKAEQQLIALTGLTGSQLGFGPRERYADTLIGKLAEQPPRYDERDLALSTSADHQLLSTRVKRSQDRLRLAQERGSGSPELSIGSSRSRGLSGDPFARTVTLSISIPFGGGSQARSDVAQITADLVRDEQDLQRFQKTFAFIWERGLAQIQEKQRASKLAVQRSLDADSIRSALVKAAEAGEVEYLERLRAERQAFEAQIAAIEADVDYQQTVSRFLQSIGRLPNGVNSK